MSVYFRKLPVTSRFMNNKMRNQVEQAIARRFEQICAYWRNFPTLQIWEAAALMHGVNPNELGDIVINDVGDSLDLSDEVRMLKDAVGTGELSTSDASVSYVNEHTKVLIESFIAVLQRRGYSSLAEGLTLPAIGSIQIANFAPSDANGGDEKEIDIDKTTQSKFFMAKRAMVGMYKSKWPSIENDIRAASENGLSAAKAGKRGWDEARALEWARSKGKLIEPSDSAVPANSMFNLPGKKHTLQT